MSYFNILILLLTILSHYTSGDPYVPQALRNKYGAFAPGNNENEGDAETVRVLTPGVKTVGVKTAGVKSAGVKTAGVKTSYAKTSSSKTGYGGGTYEEGEVKRTFQKVDSAAINYKGGCSHMPPTPMNSKIRCSQYSGCRANCVPNYQFPNGQKQLFITCNNGKWIVAGTDWEDTIPSCEPICSPPCNNNGICTSPDVCDCPENYSGTRCEFESKPCLNYPPMSLNSRRACSSTKCTITCMKGHQFPDGSSIANMICKGGSWVPSKEQWVTVPDCKATCTPPCQNGGDCLAFNVCQCPQIYKGPQCQYNATACHAQKLQFNGGYNCSGTGETFECSLSCPDGIEFEFPPASVYSCSYAEGKFLPEPVPQCVFEQYMEVVTSGRHSFAYALEGSNASMGIGDIFLGGGKKYMHKGKSSAFLPGFAPEFGEQEQTMSRESVPALYGTRKSSRVVVNRTPTPGSCFTWGGSHYKTFDGKVFSFTSECVHTLVKDGVDQTFSVTTQNSKQCQTTSHNCHKIVRIYLQDKEYVLTRSGHGHPIFASGKKILPIPGRVPGIRAEMAAHHIVIIIDSVGLKIKWDGELLLQVEVKESLWNRTAGLCGLIDGDSENDVQLRDGTIPKSVVTLATSWQVDTLGDVCQSPPMIEHACQSENVDGSIPVKAAKFCKKLLTDKRFQSCQQVMDSRLLMDACRWDFCSCKKSDPKECSCETVNMYARECRSKGVTDLVEWRDDDTCPVTCTGGRIYKQCAPTGGQPTCGGITEMPEENSGCEEGCYCPPGTVLHESECIIKSNCPCTYRGKQLPPGAHVPKDCNTCTCVDGKWVCTQISCGARCSALGDPHYITFDGTRYDFMGQCTYYLLKHANFTISAENVACAGTISEAMNLPTSVVAELPSCTRAVKIEYGKQSIKLKQNHEIIVNNQDVTKIPYKIGGITIRAVSSIFIIVELPNGVTIWWDGLTRAYIDVTASFLGQTQGLCGTFNSNQKDDFKTPEGDIEQSVIPFANKWKTSEKCSDVPDRIKSHPCNINIQNKATAEQHCKIVKSQLFSDCHLYVDPEAFYQDCLYDLCSCDGDISKCLCPMISAYASECAENGVKINWRNDVKECEIHCPGGQKYQICGNTCTRTCYHVATQSDCRRQCVEGCNCPEGEALDDRGECIPIGQCDCQHDGLSFHSGYKEVRPASKIAELCTCVNARWNCKPATPEEMKKYPAASDMKSLCMATKNEEFTTCEPVDPPTCKNMHSVQPVSVAECRPGCKCKDGYVLDTVSKSCVKPDDCPCHHGGRSYTEGATVKNDCNNCTCVHGHWKCTDTPCPAECSAWGDSHYKTFDGKLFDYQGQCDYVLAKGLIGSEHSFDISIQNVPCSTLGVSCSKSITILVGISPHQESITLTREAPVPDISKLKRMLVREVGNYVIVEEPDIELIVHWDRGTRVYVKLGTLWKNKVSGLCGNYNDNQMDDFQTPSGGITEISPQLFGNSWRLQSYCPEAIEIEDTCQKRPDRQVWALKKCGILKTSVFAPCHSEVPVESYLERCIFDTCACDQGGDCECLCTALAAYAHECNNKGVAIKWRTKTLCPMQCNEECSNYDPCITTCPIETCDNSIIFKQASESCKYDVCVEGCKIKPCPLEHIYKNSTYSECVPRKDCKPVCLEIDGEVYYEGDLIENDECYSCYCSRGKKQCQGQPCVTTPVPQTERVQCKTGWTQWINQDKVQAKGGTKGGTKSGVRKGVKGGSSFVKINDIEPLPTALVLNTLLGAHCEIGNMTDIECRTVDDHISPKETGLNVECSIEHGLICMGENEANPCPDFEIRVKCKCGVCDPYDTVNVNYKHPTDCQKFYECMEGIEGPELVEKTCGPGTLYHPVTMICDFASVVMSIRPDCGVATTTMSVAMVEPEVDLCPPGQKYVECAIDCSHLCVYYSHMLKISGSCQNGAQCEEGCVSATKSTSCPPGLFWANNHTCVSKHDCMCVSYDGKPVKPGDIIQESPCEVCQCIDNFYVCDNSICRTTTIIPTLIAKMPQVKIIPPFVSPPLQCSDDRYINLINNQDKPLGDEAFSASSVLNKPFSAFHARILSSPTKKELGRSWSPKGMDKDQYLQIDLGRQEPVYGAIVQGNSVYNEFITSYHVLYSVDGHSYNYVTDLNKQPQIFRGPVDSLSPVKQMFGIPVEAKSIRINPLTWQGRISLKVELIGCGEITLTTTIAPKFCEDPLGITNGMMADQQITVSSELPPNHTKQMIRYDKQLGWQPFTSSPSEWVQIDFLEPRNLTGFVTNGGSDGWVTAFNVKYSHNGKDWNTILDNAKKDKVFLGNYDEVSSQVNTFDVPIQARYLKIIPIKWNNVIQLRLEITGCYLPYPIIPTTTEEIPTSCEGCPGSFPSGLELGACPCRKNMWWNGETCVTRAECPCMVGHISYPVGAVFEKEDCSKCVCKLGGVEHCTPITCNACEKGLRGTISSTCKCTCRPCPDGTTLCPTSNICINTSDWCNGVKDCPDDEVNCPEKIAQIEKVGVQEAPPPKAPECPVPSCPEGYDVVINNETKAEKSQSTMFSSSYTSNGSGKRRSQAYTNGGLNGSAKGGTKGGRKGGTKGGDKNASYKGMRLSSETKTKVTCPIFACVAKASAPVAYGGVGLSQVKCPPAVCPNGYNPEFENKKNVKSTACPKYFCKLKPPTEAVCEVVGNRFTTFDHTEFKYDICNHIIARDINYFEWDIFLKRACDKICSRNLVINHEEHVFTLFPDLTIEFDGYKYTLEQAKKIGEQYQFFALTRLGDTLVFVSYQYNFWVIWDRQANVKVGVSRDLIKTVDGLCGFFNDNSKDDKRTPDGLVAKTTEEFGDSWAEGERLPICEIQACPMELQTKAWQICSLAKDETFASCASVINVENFVSKCMESICSCLESDIGSEEVEGKCKCLALQSFVVECLSHSTTEDVIDWRMKYDCPAVCTAPLIHHDCYRRRCEPTCGSLIDVNVCPKLENVCFPGCYCPSGYVRDGEKCISPNECNDCECSLLPALEYITYDQNNFTINGKCSYVMSRNILNSKDASHDFEVIITNTPCEDKKSINNKMCVGKVTVTYKGRTMVIKRDVINKKLKITVNNEALSDFNSVKDWALIKLTPLKHAKIHLHLIQVQISVFYPSLGVTLKVPSIKYSGNLEGICGDCDGDMLNDMQTPKHEVIQDINDFANAWAADSGAGTKTAGVKGKPNCANLPKEECVNAPKPDPCEQLLNHEKFGQCHPVLDPSIYIEWCKKDTCNGEAENACEAISAYARECAYAGVCIDWHSHLCPANECPHGMIFKACAAECQQTCDSIKIKEVEECVEPPFEGCFCPKGKVLSNDECIIPEKCEPCDDQGHWFGDVWMKDVCTNCTCDGHNVVCEKKTCPNIVTICEKGFMVTKIREPNQCCDKYICVPKPTEPTTCAPPKPIHCNADQNMNVIKNADGCQQFICECKPIEQCDRILPTVEPLEPGKVREIDRSGCCPVVREKCKKDKCPDAPKCEEFFVVEKNILPEKCCPQYKCLPPKDKCIVTLDYKDGLKGGERKIVLEAKKKLLKNIDESWKDGPCRECKCSVTPTNEVKPLCTVTECLSITDAIDYNNYVLKSEPVFGQCCPTIKRNACKFKGKEYKVGEKWYDGNDYCTLYECSKKDSEVKKTTSVKTCDTKCELGWEYVPAPLESKKCCGACKPVACVVDEKLYQPGERWSSPDFCIKYVCVEIHGNMHVQSSVVTCPGLSDDLVDNYVIETKPVIGECCKNHTVVACKVGSVKYKVGETWPSPDGDKCKTCTCVKNDFGEIKKEDHIQTCNKKCKKGWEYRESKTACCGECVQVACVVNESLKKPGQKWSSPDFCTNYVCADLNGTKQVQSSVVSCPQLADDLEENFVIETSTVPGECCKKHTVMACKVNGVKHKVGEKWPSPTGDKCKTYKCVRDDSGEIKKLENVQTCETTCKKGWEYKESTTKCCGECVQVACVAKDDMLKKPGEKWSSPDYCTNYVCEDVKGAKQIRSSVVNCEVPSKDIVDNFVIEKTAIPGNCCMKHTIVACKVGLKTYQVGEVWPSADGDKCKTVACIKNELGVIKKQENMEKCNKDCLLGWEYQESKTKCCGKCVQVACVVEDHLKKLGETWSSYDYCTNYVCVEADGLLQVQSSVVTCSVLAQDLIENFVVESKPVPGECCKKHTTVACKVNGVRHNIGDTWPSPHGDKCKNYTCTETELGEIKKQEHIQVCKTDCPLGWEYKESETSCCGECEQVACVVDEKLRYPAENWTSTDGCITYYCDKSNGQFMISSMEEVCPDIEDCPTEHIYVKGCCELCSYSRSQANCILQEMSYRKSRELIVLNHASHGKCTNKDFIKGLNECVGSCSSYTMYNADLGEHESKCTCCQASQYTSIIVDLVCEDDFIYKKTLRVPSHCGCQGCASEDITKTKSKSVKTG